MFASGGGEEVCLQNFVSSFYSVGGANWSIVPIPSVSSAVPVPRPPPPEFAKSLAP